MIKSINGVLCVFQGGIGEKGAEGTAGNDGTRVSEIIPFHSKAQNEHYHYYVNLPECAKIKFIVFPFWPGFGE